MLHQLKFEQTILKTIIRLTVLLITGSVGHLYSAPLIADSTLKIENNIPSAGDVFCKLAKQCIVNDPSKAIEYARKGLKQYLRNNDRAKSANAFYLIATGYKDLGNYDSSLTYYEKAYTIRTELKDTPLKIAETKNGMAIIYSMQGNLEAALTAFMQVQKLFEDSGDSLSMAKGYNNIANIYYSYSVPDKALYFYKKALDIKQRLAANSESTNTTRINMSVIYTEQKQFEPAKKNLITALEYASKTDNQADMALVYTKLGFLYNEMNEPAKSLPYSFKALSINQQLEDEFATIECYFEIGRAYSKLGNIQNAITNYKKGLEYARRTNTIARASELCELLAQAYAQTGDNTNAYKYLNEHLQYYKTIQNQNSAAVINELQQKFEVKEKEKKIEELKIIKSSQELALYKKKVQLNYTLGIFGIIIFIFLLFYYRYSEKQKRLRREKEMLLDMERMKTAAEKRIIQENQQKELLKVVINAQEEERRKIAVDIHDGLGQMLSGIKLNLHLALSDKKVSRETKEILQNIQELSNDSITESKNIASNLLPYNISGFGLVTAIKNLCYKSNQLKISNVNFYSSDVPRKLPPELEINTYRITQELINNALKHSKAEEIFVQLFYRDNKLVLQVEDNGIGFDHAAAAAQKSSMGLKNISSRILLLSGHLEIDSVPDKGTTIVVEFPLFI